MGLRQPNSEPSLHLVFIAEKGLNVVGRKIVGAGPDRGRYDGRILEIDHYGRSTDCRVAGRYATGSEDLFAFNVQHGGRPLPGLGAGCGGGGTRSPEGRSCS